MHCVIPRGHFRRFFFVFLVLTGAAGGPALRGDTSAPAPRVLRAGVETYAAPLTLADEAGKPTGFAVELLQAVAREQKLEVHYELMAWPDLLAAFKAGQLDIVCNISATPERRAYVGFTATTLLMRGGLFRREPSAPISSLADLKGRRLAVPRDSRAHEYFKTHDLGLELVFARTLRECIVTVHEGRADLVFASQIVAEHEIVTAGYRDIVPVDLLFPDFDYRQHFGVQPADTELLAQLNEGLLAVTRDGTYDRLYEKWLGPLQRRVRWRDLRPYVLPLLLIIALGLCGLAWQRRLLRQISQQADALRHSEQRLSLVIEGSQDGFWDWDVTTDQITRSARWHTMLGYAPGEIDGHRLDFRELVHPDDWPRLETDEREIWSGRDHFALEFRMKTKSGDWKWILDRGKVVSRDPHTRTPRRIAGTHTDVTARKQAEEESDKLLRKMLESQKLESLGVLAGGVAHDFNNLLTVILGGTELVRAGLPSESDAVRHLDHTLTAANRAADLCRQLLSYAGEGSVVVGLTDVNELVNESTPLLEAPLKHAKLALTLASGLPLVEADPSQLRQVIVNLVTNSAEAFGENAGSVHLTTSVVTLLAGDLPNARPTAVARSGNYVCVEVSDTGSGMTPEVLTRIFDPFYSTKFSGRGLGLPAVLGIVRAHHGALTVDSTPGLGSTFRVYLPVTERVI